MYRVLTAEQSRLAEERAIAERGVTVADLMRAAGSALADEARDRASGGRVDIVCGPGNNGGDGWAAARVLHESGTQVRVLSVKEPDRLVGAAAGAAAEARAAGVTWIAPDADALTRLLADAAVVIDALLGTGSTLPLRAPVDGWCRAVNASGACVIAADLPTGVDSDSAAADRDAIRADLTVAFATPKRGNVLFPGAANTGELVVADIGMPLDPQQFADAPQIWLASEYAGLVRIPAPDVHKNERGRVLVIAGSGRFPGAAVLAARGAMRMGAGYVTLAVPEPVVAMAQAHLLAAPVVGFSASRTKSFSSNAVSGLVDLAHEHDAVVLGPGLTLADGAVAVARALVSRLEMPLVVDADAINALVDAVDLVTERRFPTVLTPHPGELARLLGVSATEVQSDRVSSSARLASETCTVVLKGAGTVVSGAGRRVITTSGSPALATAGTGDVLAGMTGTLLAQGLDPLEAGALAAYVHGRAGEAAASRLTPVCVTAEDVPDDVPSVVGELLGAW